MKRIILQDKLSKEDIQKFIVFPEEELILATREHAAPLAIRMAKQGALITLLSIVAPIIAYLILGNLLFSLQILLLGTAVNIGLITRELVHWYFHIYIITTRKITEVRYSPLFSELSNSILLDQLRCTEIDAELRGFFEELFNIGNVVITFDRPTHAESFILKNIRSPRQTANLLSSKLHRPDIRPENMWTRSPKHGKYTYLQENYARVLPN